MQVREHRLVSPAPGTQRFLKSHHFGTPGEGEKIYLQASLHADELPGMLVLHHLQPLLAAAEAEGRIHGEIVLVPVANPIGLAQTLMHDQMGRFDFASGENFNRHHIDFAPQIQQRLQQRLTQDETHNKLLIRQAMAEVLAGFKASTELQSLRQTLMSLAFDADVVLDLHCDFEAVVHLYTGTPLWPQCEPLARYLGAEATLLAYESGGQPFDEACSQTWWKLQASLGEEFPIPLGCLSVTVELRGEQSVSHELAQQDAQGRWVSARLPTQAAALAAEGEIRAARHEVQHLETVPVERRPKAPFTTSTLAQATAAHYLDSGRMPATLARVREDTSDSICSGSGRKPLSRSHL